MNDIQLNIAGIHRAIVESVVGNTIQVILENAPYQRYNVTLISPFGGEIKPPKPNDVGVVLIQGNDGVWLGYIPQQNSQNTISPQSDCITFSNAHNTSRIAITKDNLQISNNSCAIIATPHKFEIQHKNDITFTLSNNNFTFYTRNKVTEIAATLEYTKISNSNKLHLIGNNSLTLTTKGNVIISGGIFNAKEKNEYTSLASANKVIIKSGEVKIGAHNNFSLDTGKLNINISSATISGGQVPGLGGTQACALNIIQGNMTINSAFGNIEAYAMGLPHYVAMRAGAKFDVIYSELFLNRKNAILENAISPAISSKLTLQLGSATLQASKDINLNALMQILISCNANLTLKTKTTITATALVGIKLDGKTKIELITTLLDMKNAKIIDAGAKSVPPTGSGPFCSITTCVLAGIPHVGSKAIG